MLGSTRLILDKVRSYMQNFLIFKKFLNFFTFLLLISLHFFAEMFAFFLEKCLSFVIEMTIYRISDFSNNFFRRGNDFNILTKEL